VSKAKRITYGICFFVVLVLCIPLIRSGNIFGIILGAILGSASCFSLWEIITGRAEE
jgi:hypothetical protein